MSDRLTLRHVTFLLVGLLAGWLVCEFGPKVGGHVATEERRLSHALAAVQHQRQADSLAFALRHTADSLRLDSARVRQGVSVRRVAVLLSGPPKPPGAPQPLADTASLLARLDSASVAFAQHVVEDSVAGALADSLASGLRSAYEAAQGRERLALALGDSLGQLARRRARRCGLGGAAGLGATGQGAGLGLTVGLACRW